MWEPINFNPLTAELKNYCLLKQTWAGKIPQSVKAFTVKSGDLIQPLDPTWWNERAGSHTLSSDLHIYACTYTQNK